MRNQSNVLKVNFEDFVSENKEVIKKIYDHVEIKEIRDKNNFDFLNKSNIYRYKNNLDKNEIEIMKKIKKIFTLLNEIIDFKKSKNRPLKFIIQMA